MPYDAPTPDMFAPPPPRPTLLGRIGERVANMPSNLANDILSLANRAGYGMPDDQPVQVPEVFDVPPPSGLMEGAVDMGAFAAETIPLFMGGATVGEGIAKSIGAGPRLAGAIR